MVRKVWIGFHVAGDKKDDAKRNHVNAHSSRITRRICGNSRQKLLLNGLATNLIIQYQIKKRLEIGQKSI